MALSIQTLTNNLSFSMSLSQTLVFYPNPADAAGRPRPPPSLTILMGGGPRTFPGGVSKWQWKRMQANKAKQLLKARLSRERQIYEMRKRAELRAAASELERPWEAVKKAPNLLSIAADEQLKVLADRFQRPGGFDMWTDRDGPQIFRTADDLPSARFFPKGVVHSVKPYRKEPLPGGESSETSGSDRNRHELGLRNGSNNVDKLRRNPNYGLRNNGYKRNVNSSALSDSEIGNVEPNYFQNENSQGFIEQSSNGYHEKFESSRSNGFSFSDSEIENSERLNSNNSNGFRKNSYQNNSNGFRKNGYQRKLGSSGSNGLSLSDSENKNFEEFIEQQPRALSSTYSNGFRKNGYQRKFGSSDSDNGNLQDFEEKRALSSNNPNGFRNNSNNQRKFESSGGELGDRGYRNNSRSYDSRFGNRLRSTAENSSGNRGFSREQRNRSNNGSLGSESGGFRTNENRPIVKNDSRPRVGVDKDRIGSKSPNFRRSESQYNNRGNGPKNDSRSEVFDMDLREDGSYEFR